MQFGIVVLGITDLPTAIAIDHIFGMVRKAEALGYHSVWVPDHLVFTQETASRYMMTPTGRLTAIHNHDNKFEALTLLASLASITTRVKLGTNVLVLPVRHPLLTAKMLATIDVISNGRVILGAGVGWLREEFDVFGAASYEHRGSLSDEYIRIFNEVWTKESPTFEGRWFKFSGFDFAPRPVQKPRIPIWIGGSSEAALRRVVRMGDGWHPVHLPPDLYAQSVDRLRQLCEQHGRDFGEIVLSNSIRVAMDSGVQGEELKYVPRPDKPAMFLGTPKQIVTTLRQYQALGLTHINCNLTVPEAPATLKSVSQAMEIMASEVMPHFQ